MLNKLINLFKKVKTKETFSLRKKIYEEHLYYQKDDSIIIFNNLFNNRFGSKYDNKRLELFLPDKIKFCHEEWIDLNKNVEIEIYDYINLSYCNRKLQNALENGDESIFTNDKILSILIDSLDFIEYSDGITIKLNNSLIYIKGKILNFINNRYILIGDVKFSNDVDNYYYTTYYSGLLSEYDLSKTIFNNYKDYWKFDNIIAIDINDISEIYLLEVEKRKLNKISEDYIDVIKN